MTGKQWLVEANKYRTAIRQTTWQWLEHTSDWENKERILSATYLPFQAAINRFSDLSQRQDKIPQTDPDFVKASLLRARMQTNFKSVITMRGQASDAYERVRYDNNKFTATIGKYFVDEVYKVGKKVEEIREDVLDAVAKGAKTIKQLGPMVLIAGVALVGLLVYGKFK